jgi:hypothetical protein
LRSITGRDLVRARLASLGIRAAIGRVAQVRGQRIEVLFA